LRSAVSAEPVGAPVTATYAPVILPLKGIATETRLLVVSVPGMLRTTVVGARMPVDIISPWVKGRYKKYDTPKTI
jgi:hypothetical protein